LAPSKAPASTGAFFGSKLISILRGFANSLFQESSLNALE